MSPFVAGERLIVALDVEGERQALDMVERLEERIRFFKVGSELYTACGPRIVEAIRRRRAKVFLDLKFHDIPTTVARSVAAASRLGVSIVNVHALGGEEMMRRAKEALLREASKLGVAPPRLIAVTILTSLDANRLKKVGLRDSIDKNVLSLARLAKRSGADGVVSSPRELKMLRGQMGEDFLIVTPGVRPAWAESHDQKRTLTPGEAVARGADYLVVGRPITGVENPAVACGRIIDEMAAAAAEAGRRG